MINKEVNISIYVLATAILVVGIYFTTQWSNIRNRELKIKEIDQTQAQYNLNNLQECLDAARDNYNQKLNDSISKGESIKQSVTESMLEILKNSEDVCIKQYK